MNTKDLFPFSSKGLTRDANITVSGIYHTNDGIVNLPNSVYQYGTLLVFNSGEFGVQLYMQDHVANKYIYVRVFMNSTFREWYKVQISSF